LWYNQAIKTNLKNMENRASAKDFFLHLGAMVALYTVTVSFLNLVFKIINKAFPEVAQNIYAWGAGSEISLPVATIIIFFPLFILLSYFVYKIYAENPTKKDLGVRKWLVYITLFVAGLLLAGDLVTVLYKFLDGQDLTAAFLLKALAVLLVAGCVFGFYIQDIRDKVSPRGRKMWAIVVGVIILISIILGFGVLGSPQSQRLLRYDNQKVTDLQNLQYQVISYWQMNGIIPISLADIKGQQNIVVPTDPQTQKDYEYKKTGDMNFEVCAEFNQENMTLQNQYGPVAVPTSYPAKGGIIQNDNWNHPAGRQCFERVIDPVAYPTQVRG
jgi:TRAP-type C4-dicarboxylate transport system permease small subunit